MNTNSKMTGIATTIAATITNPKTNAQWIGTLEFDWGGRTLADVLRYASADRRIAVASSIRRDPGAHRGVETIKITVPAPGVRDAATRIVSVSDVESFLDDAPQSVIDAMMVRVTERRNTDTDTE